MTRLARRAFLQAVGALGLARSADPQTVTLPFANGERPLVASYWSAEVTKMRKAYGAPIPETDTQALVVYLVSVYGK